MANIAQLVNVLQSVLLTDGADMERTPRYHVFDMYKYHQEGMLLESSIETETIGMNEWQGPNLTEAVPIAEDGTIHITVTNLSATESYPIDAILTQYQVNEVSAQIVTGAMDAKNTFEAPEVVKVEAFDQVEKTDKGIAFTIPACSVMHIAVK